MRTKAQCNTFLIAFGYDSAEIMALYDLWDWEAPNLIDSHQDRSGQGSVAAGIIDITEWSREYTLLGYDLKYQEWDYAYLIEGQG